MSLSSSLIYNRANESTRLLQDSLRIVHDTEEIGYHTEVQLRHQTEQLNEANMNVRLLFTSHT